MSYQHVMNAYIAKHAKTKRKPFRGPREAHRKPGTYPNPKARDPKINSQRPIIDPYMSKPPHYRESLPSRA